MAGAWSAPRTWSAGETVTDVMLNQQIRDNQLWLGGTTGAIVSSANFPFPGSPVSTTSGVFVASGDTVSVTCYGGPVFGFFSGAFFETILGAVPGVQMTVDGALAGFQATWNHPAANYTTMVSFVSPFGTLAAGAHTFGWSWSTNSGTLSCGAGLRTFVIMALQH